MLVSMMNTNSLDIAEVQRQIDAAPDGAVIELPAGRLEGQLVIAKAITLKGAGPPKTVIDAQGMGPTIAIDARYAEVRIEDMKITGGAGRTGGGLAITNGARVSVQGCHFERNRSTGHGGAIGLARGALTVDACTIVENEAIAGGAIYVGGDARAEINDSLVAWNVARHFGGGFAFLDGAEVNVRAVRLESNAADIEGQHVYVRGTTVRAPRIRLERMSYGAPNGDGPSIANVSGFEGEITADASSWPRDSQSVPRRASLN